MHASTRCNSHFETRQGQRGQFSIDPSSLERSTRPPEMRSPQGAEATRSKSVATSLRRAATKERAANVSPRTSSSRSPAACAQVSRPRHERRSAKRSRLRPGTVNRDSTNLDRIPIHMSAGFPPRPSRRTGAGDPVRLSHRSRSSSKVERVLAGAVLIRHRDLALGRLAARVAEVGGGDLGVHEVIGTVGAAVVFSKAQLDLVAEVDRRTRMLSSDFRFPASKSAM
jgi:hypothetical protein